MVKPGYRQTEIGVIPENWEVNSIQSVVTSYRTGGNYKNSPEATESPLIKMGNLSRGYINLHKIEYVTRGVIPNPADRLQYGDVLFNTRNTPELVGKTAVWRNELPCAYYNLNLLRFEFDSERVEPFFFNAILNTKEAMAELKNIAKGTTSVAAIYPQDLMNVKIPIPPISEQRRIAKAITDMDCLIEFLEKQIHKKKAIKQGAMQELLTGKCRLPGFSGRWISQRWKDVLDCFSSGATPYRGNTSFYNGSIKWVSSGELNYNHIMDTLEHISPEAMAKANLTMHPAGTFLMAITGLEAAGTRGSCALLGTPATTNQSCMAIYGTDKMSTEYLFHYYVQHGDELAFQYCQGTKQQSYTAAIVRELPIYYPEDIEEQKNIATLLTTMNEEIKVLEQKLQKYRQVKQAMMQQLLTGKIRLV
ncbi:MAG: restriction endonuclease subunit S [Clostridia bacterium]|nr:restriction endonuclease subunit S [Clostridia bacterium]